MLADVRARLTALLVLVFVLALVQNATGATLAHCGPSAAKTLAGDREVRVYVAGNTVYGCAAGSSRSYKLGQRRLCVNTSRAGPVTVAGDLVAYGLERCGIDTGSAQVDVLRLTDGKQLRAVSATGPPPGPESYETVNSLVLKRDGAVAWIATASSIVGHGQHVEVRRADHRGTVLLDSGTAIEKASLRLHRSQLRWVHGGATRSSTLQ